MRKFGLIIFTLSMLLAQVAEGQNKKRDYGTDSITCSDNLNIYYSLAKSRNYLQAYDSWKIVYDTCPQVSKNNFIYGPRIVEAKIKNTEDKAEKEELIDLLLEVYDKRLHYFPGKEGYVKGRKATDIMQHREEDIYQAYRLFEQAFEIGGKAQSPAFYNYYFIAAAKLFNADTFGVEEVFKAYNVVNEGIEYNSDALNVKVKELTGKVENGSIDEKEKKELARANRDLENYNKVASNLAKILAPIATCEKLTLIYNEEEFTKNKEDKVWLSRALRMLQKERQNEDGESSDCTDNPIFFDVAEAMYRLEPSARSARGMGLLSLKNKDYAKATEFFKEAIEQEVDPLKNADNHYKLGQIYLQRGLLSAAKTQALKAAQKQNGWGNPYILLAQAYAGAGAKGMCGNNVFEKKAPYWAAIDKLQYARSIDPSVAGKVNRLVSSYKEQLPNKSVIFGLGIKEGEKHTIGCFINETITVSY